MPEKHSPGGHHEKEQRPAYIDARRYPDQETAARAYMEGQIALQRAPEADVSLYRLQYGPELNSYVVALGDPPSPRLHERFEIAFGAGERAALPDDVLHHLMQRRRAAENISPWVEGHYRPGHSVRLPKRRR